MRVWFAGAWSWDACSAAGWLVVEPSGEFCVTVVGSGGEQCTSFGTWEADDADVGAWRARAAFVSPGGAPDLALKGQRFIFYGPDVLVLKTAGTAGRATRLVRMRPRCDA